MTEREPRLWIGDSNTLDRPSDSERRELFEEIDTGENKPSSLTPDAN